LLLVVDSQSAQVETELVVAGSTGRLEVVVQSAHDVVSEELSVVLLVGCT
jgi:hypothetical protein